MNILVLNAGSSSLRFQLIQKKGWQKLFKGHIDGIGLSTCKLRGDIEKKIKVKNHTDALKVALSLLPTTTIEAIGHRVVHGGEKYHQPTKITGKILRDLKKISDLAPLHNPPNLEGIYACQKLLPKTPNIAIFDTGFHATIPEHAYLYGLPYSLYKKHGIRKYGFHGTSHEHVSKKAQKWLKSQKMTHSKIITCHIGNGVSVTAVKNGKSLDTSMGFTPLEGVMMGTRSGNIDPAIPLFLQQHKKMNAPKVDHILNHESGLKGLSQYSSDMRPLWAILKDPKHKKHAAVKRAYDVYTYRLALQITSYTATLGGLDSLIFTAGIGENAWYLRRDICAHLKHLGIQLNPTKNRTTIEGKEGLISKKTSNTTVLTLKTDEELQIAKHTAKTC